jgi:hypothetical protein
MPVRVLRKFGTEVIFDTAMKQDQAGLRHQRQGPVSGAYADESLGGPLWIRLILLPFMLLVLPVAAIALLIHERKELRGTWHLLLPRLPVLLLLLPWYFVFPPLFHDTLERLLAPVRRQRAVHKLLKDALG